MARAVKLIVYPVKDLAKATSFYRTFLGVAPYAESPYYVGFRTDSGEVGLDPNAAVGPLAYVDVEDIYVSLQELVDAGGEIVQDVKEVGSGLVIAQIKDADGNAVGLRQQS